MTKGKPTGAIALAFWFLWTSLGVAAQDNVHISAPSYLDGQYMAQQRAIMADLAARNFGRRFNGSRDNDLGILQDLLDRQLVAADQTRELQAMGVVMGDLLAAELDMHWVIYEDRIGRSRALRYRETEDYLFPITMISRRQEAGNKAAVAAIYQKAHDIISASRPPLPFQ